MAETTGENGEYREILARLAAIQKSTGEDKAPIVPLIDPTANVLSLVAAAMLRQDDLRKAESRRINDLRKQADRYSRRVGKVKDRARRDQLLAEARRIDAIIAAQGQATVLSNTRAEGTATALAERVDATAKALATSVETTAKALAATYEAAVKTLVERIEPLERARYEQAGVKEQRTEGRATNQWTFERLLTIALAAIAAYLTLNR